MFDLSDYVSNPVLAYFLTKALLIVICVSVVLAASAVLNGALGRSKLERGVAGFIKSALNAVLWGIAFMVVAESFGIPVNSLIAALGVAGLALSLSVQNLLSNLFAGVQIISTHPFSVGDVVDAGGASGTVAEVRLFQTKLKTADNRIILIPNGQITAATVTNYSTEPERRLEMRFPVSAEAEPPAVRAAILGAASASAGVLAEPAPFAALDTFQNGRAEYILRVWTKNPEYWTVNFELNEAVPAALKENGIPLLPQSVAIVASGR